MQSRYGAGIGAVDWLTQFGRDPRRAEYPKHFRALIPKAPKPRTSAIADGMSIPNIGSISASPTACLLRGRGRAGTQNHRLGEAVILSTGTFTPAQ